MMGLISIPSKIRSFIPEVPSLNDSARVRRLFRRAVIPYNINISAPCRYYWDGVSSVTFVLVAA